MYIAHISNLQSILNIELYYIYTYIYMGVEYTEPNTHRLVMNMIK
jgi:hypothetical protein